MRQLHYITTLFFVGYFLLAGIGYNIIHYCCNQCEDVGITHLLQQDCEVVHEVASSCCSDDENHADNTETDLNLIVLQFPENATANTCIDDKSCEIKRIDLGEFASFKGSFLTLLSHITLMEVSLLDNSLTDLQALQLEKHTSPPPEILKHTGRDILLAKQVLVI